MLLRRLPAASCTAVLSRTSSRQLSGGGSILDAHGILGIEPGASPDEVKAAFRQKAREHHPDTAGEAQDAAAAFQRIHTAYEQLRANTHVGSSASSQAATSESSSAGTDGDIPTGRKEPRDGSSSSRSGVLDPGGAPAAGSEQPFQSWCAGPLVC